MADLKYFNKARVSNIIAASVIIWTLALWTYIITTLLTGTFIDIDHKELLLTVIGIVNGLAGYCAKHLFDNCSD